ncbi:hypothetical protein ACQ4PT_041905 [Festuca glaucescens]
MDGGKSNKRQAGEAVARADGQSSAKRQNVTMGLDTLDCPICSQPLRPPIFQCPKGNFICSLCCEKLPEGALCFSALLRRGAHHQQHICSLQARMLDEDHLLRERRT